MILKCNYIDYSQHGDLGFERIKCRVYKIKCFKKKFLKTFDIMQKKKNNRTFEKQLLN